MGDLFDEVLMWEERSAKIGNDAGVAHGKKVGKEQGYSLGVTKGSHLGAEVCSPN